VAASWAEHSDQRQHRCVRDDVIPPSVRASFSDLSGHHQLAAFP
jgi:hypothetical protein